MFSFEEKRDEAKLHLAHVRKRLRNAEVTKRGWARLVRREQVVEEIIADYERAMSRIATQEAAESFQRGEGSQYLLNLERSPAGSLWPANGIPEEGCSD